MDLERPKTPCALVDLDRLEANARGMAARAAALGVRLRPHVKTHKCVEIAARQVTPPFQGVTVSTLAEAHAFADGGFCDLTWAFPLPPDRVDEALDLARRVDALHLTVDHEASVDALERACRRRDASASVLLEVDCGARRAGVDPSSDRALRLAKRIADSDALAFRGLLTHGGHAYGARSRDEIAPIAAAERDAVVRLAARLREAGIGVPEVSVGSTPTMRVVDHLEGVTEIRPGNYVLFDAFQAAIGSCALEEVAISILATVVGAYPDQRKVIVNAGAIALSTDPGPTHVDPACGFGVVAAADGRTLHDDLRVFSLSQEHGQIRGEGVTDRFRIGDRLRILPNHACVAAAQHDRLFAIRDGAVVETWRPVRGW
ncbi:MAG: alanine racemase [Planctomycetota bacterium JB042]